jgi:hypothetical protein
MASSLQAVEPLAFLKLLAHQVRWKLLAALARSDYRVAELVALTYWESFFDSKETPYETASTYPLHR